MKNLLIQLLNELDAAFYELDDKANDISVNERTKLQERFDNAYMRLEEIINEKI